MKQWVMNKIVIYAKNIQYNIAAFIINKYNDFDK